MKFLTLSLLCIIGGSLGQHPADTYPHKAVLDARGQIKLYWKVNSTHITFEVHGHTTGWIGMGISPNGGMIGADIYVGWVKDGIAYINDRHGDSIRNAFPSSDTTQNVELLGGSECNGWTILTFQRQIAACDGTDDITITTSTQKIIWAMGQDDPTESDITPSEYHGNKAENRGTKSLLLLEGGTVSFLPPDEPEKYFDILNDKFTVPPVETHYRCRLMQLPDLDTKHHIVKIEPRIQSGNEPYVHHILIYECDYDNLQALYYPNHVGYPIGTVDGPKYIVMETHYDNPGKISGIVDSSGFRVTYTSQLRPNDAGVLEVGHTVLSSAQLIPPNADSFNQYAECSAGCMTEGMKAIGQSDIKLFGALLHTHLLGKAITLKHIQRNGKELPYIAQDLSYDFNYQEVKMFPKEIVFNSGDSMQIVCNYNSKTRTNATYGGLSTSEEMCLAFVSYYPKIPIKNCESFPWPDQLYGYFGASGYTISRSHWRLLFPNDVTLSFPGGAPNQTLPNVMNALPWDQERAKNFSDATLRMWNIVRCKATSTVHLQIPGIIPPLNITQVYTPPTPTCIEPNTGMPTSLASKVCPVAATPTPTMTTTSGAPQVAIQSLVLMTMELVTMAVTIII